MDIIDETFEDLTEEDLATDVEAAEARPPSYVLPLTSDLVLQVLVKLRAGETFREIKKTVVSPGPDRQKYTLSFAQIQDISERRRQYYHRLKNVEPTR